MKKFGYNLLAVAILLSGLTGAFAQEVTTGDAKVEVPAPATSVAPAAAPQRFWLEVDQSDLAAISQALNELPKRVADPLILRLNSQLQNQQMISAAAAKALEPKEQKKKK